MFDDVDNADVFGDDQYSEFTLAAEGSPATYVGPACRLNSSGNGYGFLSGNNAIYRLDAGVFTSIGTTSATWAATDVIRMEALGDVITIYQNGVSVGSATDSTYSSGSAGLLGSPTTGVGIDLWEGGNLGGGGFDPSFALEDEVF